MRTKIRLLPVAIGIFVLFLLICFPNCIRLLNKQKKRVNNAVYHFHASTNEDAAYISCTIDTCVNLLPCSIYDNRLTVYVEPLLEVFDEHGVLITPKPSKEFLKIRSVIHESKFAVNNVEDACLTIPGFDTLNLLRFPYSMALNHALEAVTRTTTSLIFVFVGARIPAGKMIVARYAIWNSQTYDSSFRHNYDLAIPFWYEKIKNVSVAASNISWFLTVVLYGLPADGKEHIRSVFVGKFDVLILETCTTVEHAFCDINGRQYEIIKVFRESKFVMIFDDNVAFEWMLPLTLKLSTVPVIISDQPNLPFDDILDWNKFSFVFYIGTLDTIYEILKAIETWRIEQLQKMGRFAYSKYFSSLESIVLTTLEILQKRLVSSSISFKPEWNEESLPRPLFLPRIAPLNKFTTVIFCFPFLKDSLLVWLDLLDKTPSLEKIIVIIPTSYSLLWKEFEVRHYKHDISGILTQEFMAPARFINSPEITSEAVFSVNAIIDELTVDQIEYGYKLWRHNPSDLVIFSATDSVRRINISTHQDSLWENIFLNSKGFFYHNYYNVLYHRSPTKVYNRAPMHSKSPCQQHEESRFAEMFERILIVRVPPTSKCSNCQHNKDAWKHNSFEVAKETCVANSNNSQQFNRRQSFYVIHS